MASRLACDPVFSLLPVLLVLEAEGSDDVLIRHILQALFDSDSLSLACSLRPLKCHPSLPCDAGPYWDIPACGRIANLKLNLLPEGPLQLFSLDPESSLSSLHEEFLLNTLKLNQVTSPNTTSY